MNNKIALRNRPLATVAHTGVADYQQAQTCDVAYVLRRYPVLSETFVSSEVRELSKRGIAPLVLSLLDNNIVSAPGHDAMVEIRRYRYLSLRDTLYLLRCVFAHPRWAATLLGSFLRLLPKDPKTAIQIAYLAPKLIGFAEECQQRRVHHVHSHFGGLAAHCGALVAAMIGKKFSFMFHTIPEMDYPRFDEHLRRASSVLVNSENNLRAVQARFGDLVANKMHLVRSAFGLEEFSASAPVTPQKDVDVISIGRLWPKKGFDTLLQAMELLRATGLSAKCVIIGDGPDRQSLENFIRDHDLARCSLAGAVSHDGIKSMLSRARIFVLPCKQEASNGKLHDEDGLPVAITEALASGLPVISCDVGGIGEVVIDGKTGFIVPQNSPADLAAAMERLLRDENLRSGMGHNAVALIREKYDCSGALNTLLASFGIGPLAIPDNKRNPSSRLTVGRMPIGDPPTKTPKDNQASITSQNHHTKTGIVGRFPLGRTGP